MAGAHEAAVSWDSSEGELLCWDNHLQAWDDADPEDDKGKEWFDLLPLATADQIHTLTGSPGMLETLGKGKVAAVSSAQALSPVPNANDPSLHRLVALRRYAPLGWCAEMSCVMHWDTKLSELQWWNNHSQGWDDMGGDEDSDDGSDDYSKAWLIDYLWRR